MVWGVGFWIWGLGFMICLKGEEGGERGGGECFGGVEL